MERSFTLIELLVVIAIIGILAGMVLMVLNSARASARDATRVLELKQFQNILELYLLDNNSYLLSTADFEITGAPWGGSWPGYTENVPKDPVSTQSYAYISDGTAYQIYAKFEKAVDRTFSCGACGPDNNYNAVFASPGSILQNLTGYVDSDGDTYGAGSPTNFGSISSLPLGYVTDGSDCDDNPLTDSTKWRLLIGYPDSDGDGYGGGSGQQICSGNFLPTGYVSQGGDCYDFNANARPSQTSFFTVHRGDGSFDYNCDFFITKSIFQTTLPGPTGCLASFPAGTSVLGFASPGPSCGGSGTHLECWNYTTSDCSGTGFSLTYCNSSFLSWQLLGYSATQSCR